MGDTIRDAVQVPPQVVKLREKGQFTVPAKIRKSMGIQEDDLLTVFQWGNSFIAVPGELVVQKEARAIVKFMKERGITLEDLLVGLEEERAAISEERYGSRAWPTFQIPNPKTQISSFCHAEQSKASRSWLMERDSSSLRSYSETSRSKGASRLGHKSRVCFCQECWWEPRR